MAEVGLLYGDRVWFSDARSPSRRLAVSSHPEAAVVILSLWTGDTCTSTFQVPIAEAATLISTLAAGMARAVPPTVFAPVATPNPSTWRDRAIRLVGRLRTRVTRA